MLGYGTSDSWSRRVAGSFFTGPASVAEYDFSGNVPLAGDRAHWQDDITDGGSETAMDPTISNGQRTNYTALDFAGLVDIGWELGVPVDVGLPTIVSTVVNGGLTDPPDVPGRGIQPSSWQQQASDIRSIEVTFSEAVIVSPSDLILTNLGVNAPADSDTFIPLSADQLSVNGSVLTISFDANELPEGVYQFVILGSVTDTALNRLDGNGDGIGGDPFIAPRFHRFQGDFDGNGVVDISDVAPLIYWFFVSVPRPPDYVDFNLSGQVDISDIVPTTDNFFQGVTYPGGGVGGTAPSSVDTSDSPLGAVTPGVSPFVLPSAAPIAATSPGEFPRADLTKDFIATSERNARDRVLINFRPRASAPFMPSASDAAHGTSISADSSIGPDDELWDLALLELTSDAERRDGV